MGMVIDDPEDPKQVVKKLVYHFEKARTSTRVYEYEPRTTFITSMNLSVLRRVVKEARYKNYVMWYVYELCWINGHRLYGA